jgi:very-short-patch-repair endonuclease
MVMKQTEFEYKLDYIARLFRSIRNKRFESYVIQRIWHKLDDDRVLFSTQQFIERDNNGKYALADLYLPQLNILIEVDEAQHNTKENKELDKQRSIEIESKISGVCIKRIPIFDENNNPLSMKKINDQVDCVVEEIKTEIKKLEDENKFIPWNGNFLTPNYHKKKGYLDVKENEYVKNIDDAATIFDTQVVHKGFLRPGGFPIPDVPNTIVWLPSVDNKHYSNKLEGDTIYEYNINDPKRSQHVKTEVAKDETRVTFFREKDALGFNYYKFIGVFKLDKEQSEKDNKCVWKRVSERYDLRSKSYSTNL